MAETAQIRQKDISVVLGGAAGQGIQTIESILTLILKRSGYHIFSTKEYMSRIRGGSNSTLIRVSSERIASYVDRIDLLMPLNGDVLSHLEERISPDTLIIGDSADLTADHEFIDVPFSSIAEEAGGRIYLSTVAVGVLAGIFEADISILEDHLKERFSSKAEGVVEGNIAAVRKGYEVGLSLCESGSIPFHIPHKPDVSDEVLINGGEAISMGCIAGGCNFISSYPMSPSTAVLTFMSAHDEMFGIVAEQAEDEIAAINMAIGAWYAGARGMVTTSGGGFALMEEGISLAGMMESPVVVHLAQRPGPGTGLPTRTEQGDLELVLYSGHGEFPKIIYAPGTTSEAFALAGRAFNMADKHQVPVFILTDQFFMDSYYNIPALDTGEISVEKHIIKTDRDYSRYRITENGISPRGVPGYGKGLVRTDSDEHDEEGQITESMKMRTDMVDKRLRKGQGILEDSLLPYINGPEDFNTAVIGWGSTYHMIDEALSLLGRKKTAHLHFSQVFPLHPDTSGITSRAQKIIVVENNATSQFGRLLESFADVEVHERILKYNGLPFSVEELAGRLDSLT